MVYMSSKSKHDTNETISPLLGLGPCSPDTGPGAGRILRGVWKDGRSLSFGDGPAICCQLLGPLRGWLDSVRHGKFQLGDGGNSLSL